MVALFCSFGLPYSAVWAAAAAAAADAAAAENVPKVVWRDFRCHDMPKPGIDMSASHGGKSRPGQKYASPQWKAAHKGNIGLKIGPDIGP